MRTAYARDKGGSASAPPRGLHQILSEDLVQAIVRRETSRADRTGRHFSVVLFEVQSSDKRWSPANCRMARTLLGRVRQTDDVGWFDERHLCVILADTPAAGARVFASQTSDAIAAHQPRPLSIVYGYPGTVEIESSDDSSSDDDDGGDDYPRIRVDRPQRRPEAGHNGQNGRNGHGRSNGHSHRAALRHADDDIDGVNGSHRNSGGGMLALAEAPAEEESGLAETDREELVEYFLEGAASRSGHTSKEARVNAHPDIALEDLFARPMPKWKRALDIVGASVGLTLLSPILGAAALAIRLSSSGPAIFKQQRSGLGGKPFTIYKFRTMCVDAERKQDALRAINEQDGPAFKLKNDPRVTKIGKLLRKTSIDELPQLFNVLKGNMSLVGPRPLPIKEQEGCEPWQRHRLNVTPGLTCIWQVDGRSEVMFDEWVRMDVKYMRNQSLWHDLSIIFRTIPAVLLKKGAR